MAVTYNRKGTVSRGIYGRSRKRHVIVPRVEKCQKCKKRKVRHHHYLCDKCYDAKRPKK